MKRLKSASPTTVMFAAGIMFLVFGRVASAQQSPFAKPLPTPPALTPPNPNPPPDISSPATPLPINPSAAVPLPGPDGAIATGAANSGSEPGFLGVVTDDRQEKGAGVRVLDVENSGPADTGGLKTDDLITAINGNPVHAQNDMTSVMQKLGPGSKVAFSVDRGGQQATINVTLGNRPPVGQRRFEKFGKIPEALPDPSQGGGIGPEAPANSPNIPRGDASAPPGLNPEVPNGPAAPNAFPNPPSPESGLQFGSQPPSPIAPSRRPLLGVRTRPVDDEAQQRLHLSTSRGALVVTRTDGGPAARAGIPLGSVITAVDGRPVDSPPDLTALIVQAGAGREVEVSYLYRESEHRAKVRLGDFGQGAFERDGMSGTSPLPTPPNPDAGQLPAPSDKTRIDALERRVEQLEHRIDDLQQELHRLR